MIPIANFCHIHPSTFIQGRLHRVNHRKAFASHRSLQRPYQGLASSSNSRVICSEQERPKMGQCCSCGKKSASSARSEQNNGTELGAISENTRVRRERILQQYQQHHARRGNDRTQGTGHQSQAVAGPQTIRTTHPTTSDAGRPTGPPTPRRGFGPYGGLVGPGLR